MMDNEKWEGNERRSESITMAQIENCVYKALAQFRTEEKQHSLEKFRLHQAECPAYHSSRAIKWLLGLPVISTAVTVILYYFGKTH